MEEAEDSFWRRAVGTTPKIVMKVGDRKVMAVADTGSQVTTMTESYFHRHFQDRLLESNNRFITLTAANGQPIERRGYFVTDVTVDGETVEDTVIIIIKNPNANPESIPCLLGMNVLQRLAKFPQILAAQPSQSKQSKVRTCLARSTRSQVLIPARTALNVTLLAGDPSMSSEVLVEQTTMMPRPGLMVLSTYTRLEKGRLTALVANTTDEAVMLHPRTVVGVVSDATAVKQAVSMSVKVEGSEAQQAEEEPATDHKLDDIEIDPSLSAAEASQLRELLRKYSDCFAWSDAELGYTDRVKHEIVLTDETPIAQPYRRIPPGALKEVKDHIEDLLTRGVIQPSSSPYASPIVVVRKKNGEIRLCVDYRKVNAVTRRDQYPLPRIDECLDALGDAKYFTTLDLASGYHQVAMADQDKQKTAFTCPFGLYEYNRMPFGLCNAPATFQRLMQSTMHDFIFSLLVVYLDDLLIYAKNFQEHLEALEKVFKRLREIGVKLNPPKCKFALPKVPFLGHVVSDKGIGTDPAKIEAILNWPVPKSASDVRSFLGLASYYRRFVKNFAKIAKPLNELYAQVHKRHQHDHKKGEKKPLGDLWTPECQEAFFSLKMALTTPPVLGYADYTKEFVVEVDASLQGLGAVLSQKKEGKTVVIAYASRSLRKNEKNMQNYSSMKLELLALKWAITEKWRDYLLRHKCRAFTDNNPLAHWQTAKFGAVEQRWLADMAPFDFTVEYRSGKENKNADALSRHPTGQPGEEVEEFTAVTHVQAEPVTTTAREEVLISTAAHHPPSEEPALSDIRPVELPLDDILCEQVASCPVLATPMLNIDGLTPKTLATAQREDVHMAPILKHVQQGSVPSRNERSTFSPETKSLNRQLTRLYMGGSILMKQLRKEDGEVLVPVLPTCRRSEAIFMAHDLNGHQGAERTLSILRKRCYWPNMEGDVADAVRRCGRCQLAKTPRAVHQPAGHLVATQPLEILALDFAKLDRAADGTENVLVMTDVFTKMAAAVATRDQTAATVVRALVEKWIVHFGAPLRIHSDQGKCFAAEVVAQLCGYYGIQRSRSTAYHPQGNGQVERFNKSLASLLTTLPLEAKKRWPKHLDEVVFFYNSTPHSTTGQSPYSLMFGVEPRLPIDMFLNMPSPTTAADDYLQQHVKRLNDLRQRAIEHTKYQHEKRANVGSPRGVVLRPGDEVLLKLHPMGRHKLHDHYGATPLKIISVPPPSGGYFRVKHPDGREQNVTGSNIRPYTAEESVVVEQAPQHPQRSPVDDATADSSACSPPAEVVTRGPTVDDDDDAPSLMSRRARRPPRRLIEICGVSAW